jgi:calcineurin-like phosphoesterase family protein
MRIRWEEAVGPQDTVLHLGDLVCFEKSASYAELIASLPGHKLLLRGNHDKHAWPWYEAAGWTVLGRNPILWHRPDNGKVICFSHEPCDLGGWSINVHGHIHANPYYDPSSFDVRRNVCVEVTGYAPLRLRDVLDAPNRANVV